MRYGAYFGSLAAAALASEYADALRLINFNTPADFTKPKRRRTGVTYPHSSTRQRARYARQIAAGQIKNAR